MRDMTDATVEDAGLDLPEVIVADRQAIVCQGLGSLVAQISEVRLGPFATDLSSLRKALGAHSVCMMGQVLSSLPRVLVHLVEGHSILPVETLKRLMGEQGDSLTRREHEILGLLVDGLTNFQISARLGLSENTVKYYLKAIYQKLDVNSRGGAIAKYVAGTY